MSRSSRLAKMWCVDCAWALLLLLVGLTAMGCRSESATLLTPPTDLQAVQLTDLSAFPLVHRSAAVAVGAYLQKQGETPDDFFAEVSADGDLLTFHLWHRSAFDAQYANTAGNPGGRCRDVVLLREPLAVLRESEWQ